MEVFIWSAFKVLIWTLAALHAVVMLSTWYATIRTLGISSLRNCSLIFFLSFRAWPLQEVALLLSTPFVVLLLIYKLGLGPFYLAVFPVNALLLIAIMMLTLVFVPPIAVVFSSSTDRQLRWALALKGYVGGRRVVSLLDTGYVKVKPTVADLWAVFSRRALTVMDVLRTSENSDWQASVKGLIEMAPIVIIDTRLCTRATLFEASTVLTNHYAYKAVFVSEDDGSCPVLDRLVADRPVSGDLLVSIVKEDELEPLLRRLVSSRRTLPKPGSFPSAPVLLRDCAKNNLHKPVSSSHTNSPAHQQTADTIAGIESPKRLSISLTPALRKIAKAFVVNIVFTLILAPFVILQAPQIAFLSLSRTAWAVLIGTHLITAFICFYVTYSLKDVYLAGDYLWVSDQSKRLQIPLSSVTHVTGPDWTTLRRISLHLRQPSEFGKKIVFAGGPIKAGATVRGLRQKVYARAEAAH